MKKHFSIFLAAVLTSHTFAQDEDSYEISVTAGWDSKYISEGRDNLDGGGLVSFALDSSFEFFAGHIHSGLWHAEAERNSDKYNELNAYIGYDFSLGFVDVAFAYTRLEFLSDDEFDNELSIGLSKNLGEGFTIGLDAIYSTEAEGTFFELTGSYEHEVTDQWTLGTTLLLGVNQGYVPDEHDGLNNIQLSLESSYELSDSLFLQGYVTYTLGLDERSGESLEDLFFGGVSLVYSF